MQGAAEVAFYLGVVAYSAATALFFLELARSSGRRLQNKPWAPKLLTLGALAHGAYIVTTSVFTRTCPVSSVQFSLSLSALATVGVFLVWRRSEPINALGAFLAPLALASLIAAQVVTASRDFGQLSHGMLALHVTVNLVGFALFLLAGAAGAFYLVAERRLKSKRWAGAGPKLPPLDVLDRAEHRFLLAGFPLLTVGILTGVLFSASDQAASGPEVARSLFAYGSWGLLALVLILRAAAGWRGRKAAYGTLAGVVFILMVVAIYLGGIVPGGGS